MLEIQVKKLLEAHLELHAALFLVDMKISPSNEIVIRLDSDNGITLKDCIDASRAIEHQLDREEHDFSLEVTSPGIEEGLLMKRQYKKNIGRKLEVVTENNTYSGTLIDVNEESIVLTWKAREPKPIGKGKVTVEKKEEVPFDHIKKAKVLIVF